MDKIKNIVNKFLLVKSTLKIIFFIISIVILLIILIVLALNIPCTYNDFKYNKFRQQKPFNSETWKRVFTESDGKEITSHWDDKQYEKFGRCYMYNDLIKNKLHFNMLYKEVVKLLGKPREVIYYVNPDIKRIVYFIGYCIKSSCGYNPVSSLKECYLSLYFDKNLKLIAYGRQKKEELGYIAYDQMPSIEEAKRLFRCDTNPGYYNTIQCARTIDEVYDEGVRYLTEYCNIDEVKSKWGYEIW